MSALSLPDVISGPISVHVFNNIIILGDAHFSDANMCDKCEPPGCETIVSMLHRFVKESGDHGRDLDVHIELPYVPPARNDWKHRFNVLKVVEDRSHLNASDASDAIDASSGTAAASSAASASASAASAAAASASPPSDSISYGVHRAASARRLGMLGRLYHNFKKYLYDDDAKRVPGQHVRFHYIDIRLDPNISALPQYLTTVEDMHTILTALIFGAYSAADASKMPFLAHPESLSRYRHRSKTRTKTRSRTVHKVTKQYLKLMDHPVACELFPNVTTYLQDRIHDLCDATRIQMQLSDSHSASDRRVLGGDATFLVMDAYLLCRALYFAAEHAAGTTVVYVGGKHVENIVMYMMHYEHKTPSLCHKLTRSNSSHKYNRCISTGASEAYKPSPSECE